MTFIKKNTKKNWSNLNEFSSNWKKREKRESNEWLWSVSCYLDEQYNEWKETRCQGCELEECSYIRIEIGCDSNWMTITFTQSVVVYSIWKRDFIWPGNSIKLFRTIFVMCLSFFSLSPPLSLPLSFSYQFTTFLILFNSFVRPIELGNYILLLYIRKKK